MHILVQIVDMQRAPAPLVTIRSSVSKFLISKRLAPGSPINFVW